MRSADTVPLMTSTVTSPVVYTHVMDATTARVLAHRPGMASTPALEAAFDVVQSLALVAEHNVQAVRARRNGGVRAARADADEVWNAVEQIGQVLTGRAVHSNRSRLIPLFEGKPELSPAAYRILDQMLQTASSSSRNVDLWYAAEAVAI